MSYRKRLLLIFPLFGFILGVVTPSKAIINGTQATEGEFPSTAAILKNGSFSSPALIGGGSLVGDQWVVTTAHSLIGETTSSIRILLGTQALDGSGITRYPLAIYIHPDYRSENGTSTNDIALILLDRPVSTVPVLPYLTNSGDISTGDATVVVGWGTTTAGEINLSNELLTLDMEIVSRAATSMKYPITLGTEHLPAIDPSMSGNPCYGDSGGPLVKSIADTDTLVGLVSFGSGDCDDPTIPTVFTNVVEFAPWLTSYLDLTAEASSIRITGKGKAISNGDRKPRRADGTDFGTFSSKRKRVTRTFQVANAGSGLLTVRSASASGRSFSVRRAPSKLIGSGSGSPMKLTFRPKGKRKKHRALIHVLSNDPATPIHTFRVQASVR